MNSIISKKMIGIMKKAPGVGLAANQIGVLKKIVTVHIQDTEQDIEKTYALFNPIIKSYLIILFRIIVCLLYFLNQSTLLLKHYFLILLLLFLTFLVILIQLDLDSLKQKIQWLTNRITIS